MGAPASFIGKRMNNQAGENTVIQHQMVEINKNIAAIGKLFFKRNWGVGWGGAQAGDFQREGSERSGVNFGHIVPHYRWDLTIS